MASHSVDSRSHSRWIEEMRNFFRAHDHLSCTQFNTFSCVYRVPENFTETRPEAYTPLRIGLGPYHHLRPQLYKMHMQKLVAVRESQSPETLPYIHRVVSSLSDFESEVIVRACYDQYLDLDAGTLAWIVAIDGLFLLRYLKSALDITSGNDCLGGPETDSLVGDIFMLENQIPYILLKAIGCRYRRCLIKDDSNEVHLAYVDFLLNGGFLALCQKYSPLELSTEWAVVRETNSAHLLHRMYQLIACNTRSNSEMVLCGATHDSELQSSPTWGDLSVSDVFPPCSIEDIHQTADKVDSMLDQVFPTASDQMHLSVTVLNGQPIARDDSLAHLLTHMYRLVNVIVAKYVKPIIEDSTATQEAADAEDDLDGRFPDLPNHPMIGSAGGSTWENVKKIPELLKELGVPGAGTADRFLSIIGQVPWDKVSALRGPKAAECPPVEQIKIPTVSEMSKVLNITFVENLGGIRDAKFDRKESKLYLPTITLNTHSEIILRNLLAYEAASAKPESSLELAEYVDMMCGMIDTKKDVEILKKAKIIRGKLPDEEMVAIFNGIRKTTGEGERRSDIGKAIDDINKLYSDVWRVKAKRKLGVCGSVGLKYINAIAVIVIMVLMLAQAFCTLFGCSRWIGKTSANLQLYGDH